MSILLFIAGMMLGAIVAFVLHCILIVGKQADENIKD